MKKIWLLAANALILSACIGVRDSIPRAVPNIAVVDVAPILEGTDGGLPVRQSPPPTRYIVSTLPGPRASGSDDGSDPDVRFCSPTSIAPGPNGSLYVADAGNHAIFEINADDEINVYAGNGIGCTLRSPQPLDVLLGIDYVSTETPDCAGALFNGPTGIAVDKVGNVYVGESWGHVIRKIKVDSCDVTTLAGKRDTEGYSDGKRSAARFKSPDAMAVDTSGNVYVADNGNNRIRKVTLAGVVTTIAGSGKGGHDDGEALKAMFDHVSAITIDADASILYVGEGFPNNDIRRITLDSKGNAITVSTLAGSRRRCTLLDELVDGIGVNATFCELHGMAIDAEGNLYVTDSRRASVRKVLPTGEVTTIAGLGKSGSNDGPTDMATFHSPRGLAVVAAKGTIYVIDSDKIRKLTPVH